MKTWGRFVVVWAMTLVITSSLIAGEKKGKKPTKAPAKKKEIVAVKVPKGIKLTEQQQEAVAALNKEYSPKLTELRKKQGEVLTAEQKQALGKAKLNAKKEGKKGKEAAKAIYASIQLSEEQKQQQVELKRQFASLNKEIQASFVKLLTTEQLEMLKKLKAAAKAKKKGAGKKISAKQVSKKPSGKKPTGKKPVSKQDAAKKGTKKPVKKTTDKKQVQKKPAKKSTDKKPVKKSTEKKPVKQTSKKPVKQSSDKKPEKKSQKKEQ